MGGSVSHGNTSGTSITTTKMIAKVFIVLSALLVVSVFSKPWYQGSGLPDCAPGLCPYTAEISPIKCSSDPVLFFNNGYPMLCQEGFTCDTAAADAGEGNPCRAAEDGAGYE